MTAPVDHSKLFRHLPDAEWATTGPADTVEDARVSCNLAADVAAQLEGQLAEVIRLVRDHLSPHEPHDGGGMNASRWERQNNGKCRTCLKWWPCQDRLFLDRLRAATR